MIITIRKANQIGVGEKNTESGTFCAYGVAVMKKDRFACAFTFLLLFATGFGAHAAVVCVGPSATGSGSGADWNNLKAWSGTPARGETWYLVDGSYGAKNFTTVASGSTIIVIKKATVADHGAVSTGWLDTMGDGQAVFSPTIRFGSSYWTFDGTRGVDWSTSASNYGFAFTSGISGLFVIGTATGQTITDITVSRTYAQGVSADTGKYAILCYPVNATARITVSHNYWDNWNVHVMANTQTDNSNPNWLIKYNLF